MPVANVIAVNLQPIALPAPLAKGKSGHVAGFHVPHQEQDNWCWAAVAAGVAAKAGVGWQQCAIWQQCDIASLELGQQCCPSGTHAVECNIPYYLDRALQRVGHFRAMQTGSAQLVAEVVPEINVGRPIGVRIGWPGPNGGGHFIAIAGYSINGVDFVDIEDPWWSASTVTYQALQNAYQGNGTWTHTYWTN